MNDSKFLLMFGSMFAGIGSIFAVTGIVIGVNTYSFVTTAVTTPGTVVDLVQSRSTDTKGRSSIVYHPVVKFATNSGEPTTFISSASSDPSGFTKGQQVQVLYPRQRPNSATINSPLDLWLGPTICTAMGSLFVLIGGIALIQLFPQPVKENKNPTGAVWGGFS